MYLPSFTKGKAIYESSVCLEYIDEVWSSNEYKRILSSDPYQKAFDRIWGDHISNKIIPQFYVILNKKTTEEREKGKKEFALHLEELVKVRGFFAVYLLFFIHSSIHSLTQSLIKHSPPFFSTSSLDTNKQNDQMSDSLYCFFTYCQNNFHPK